MSAQRTVRSSVENVFQKSQGALLLIGAMVALLMCVAQISVITETTGFLPIVSLRSYGLGFDVVGFTVSAMTVALAYAQGRLRIPASFLTAAFTLTLYFNNTREQIADSILARSFPSPIPRWLTPTVTFLVAVAFAAVLVSLWRHKHDPDAAF